MSYTYDHDDGGTGVNTFCDEALASGMTFHTGEEVESLCSSGNHHGHNNGVHRYENTGSSGNKYHTPRDFDNDEDASVGIGGGGGFNSNDEEDDIGGLDVEYGAVGEDGNRNVQEQNNDGSRNNDTLQNSAGNARTSKGKRKKSTDKDDASDSEDSLFGGDSRGALLQQVRAATGFNGGLTLFVHHPVLGENGVWYVLLVFSGALPWYLPPEVMKGLLLKSVARSALFTRTGKNWAETLTKSPIRVVPHGNNAYKRSSRNWTTDYVNAVLEFRERELDSLPAAVDEIVKLLINLFGEHRSRCIGDIIAPLLQEAKPQIYDNEIRKGSAKTETEMASRITSKLNGLFKAGKVDVQYDVHYNRFLTDYDIKEFLTNYIGVQSFTSLDEDTKKNLFKFYPRDRLPEWSQISMESLIL